MRLIDADAAIDMVNGILDLDKYYRPHAKSRNVPIDEVIDRIELTPTIDAVPVRHGHWQITDAYPHNVHCSVCHKRFAQTQWAVWGDGSLPRNYCPHCGARMDGDRDEPAKRL